MKAFHFRLEQALRWRSTQLDLAKASVSLAAQQVQELRGQIETWHSEVSKGATELPQLGVSGSSMALWSAFEAHSRRRIAALEAAAQRAGQELAARMRLMVEANRQVQLLRNLKDVAQSGWQSEFNRELEAFAGESWLIKSNLNRLQSRSRTGA